jgi:hypothetical protein
VVVVCRYSSNDTITFLLCHHHYCFLLTSSFPSRTSVSHFPVTSKERLYVFLKENLLLQLKMTSGKHISRLLKSDIKRHSPAFPSAHTRAYVISSVPSAPCLSTHESPPAHAYSFLPFAHLYAPICFMPGYQINAVTVNVLENKNFLSVLSELILTTPRNQCTGIIQLGCWRIVRMIELLTAYQAAASIASLHSFKKWKGSLWDHQFVSLSVRLCPPLITFEPSDRFSWNSAAAMPVKATSKP